MDQIREITITDKADGENAAVESVRRGNGAVCYSFVIADDETDTVYVSDLSRNAALPNRRLAAMRSIAPGVSVPSVAQRVPSMPSTHR